MRLSQLLDREKLKLELFQQQDDVTGFLEELGEHEHEHDE